MKTNSSCHNITSGSYSNVFISVYSITFIAGLLLNLLALVVFFSCNKSRSNTIVYMTNLAIADLLLVITLPVRIYHHLGFPGLPQKLCNWLGLMLLANMYSSIFLLTCNCFDRCMAVTFPMSHRVKQWRNKAPLVCFAVWVFTFGASLVTFLSKQQREEMHCFGNLPVYAVQPVVVFATLSIGFGIPLALMLACSWGLVRAIRHSTVAQTNLVDSRKIQRMIAASLLIFLISFLPYHATLGLLYAYRENVPCLLLAAYRYSLMVACLNTILDPIAYYFTTETFRKKVDMEAVRKMFLLSSQSSLEAKTIGLNNIRETDQPARNRTP